jgi:hypothetical protein
LQHCYPQPGSTARKGDTTFRKNVEVDVEMVKQNEFRDKIVQTQSVISGI